MSLASIESFALNKAIPIPSPTAQKPNPSYSPDVTLQLGPFTFEGPESPENINFGGAQMLAVHQLIGGDRTVDAMGRNDDDITWKGLFFGTTASARAQYLDGMRIAGKAITLKWGKFSYQVVIKSFKPEFQQTYKTRYTIVCTVVKDQTKPVKKIPPFQIKQQLQDQLKTASSLAACTGSSLLGGLMGDISSAVSAIPSAVSGVMGDVGSAVTGAIGSVESGIGSALGGIGSAIGSAESALGGIGSDISGAVGAVSGAINTVAGLVTDAEACVAAATSSIQGAISSVLAPIEAAQSAVQGLLGQVNSAVGIFGTIASAVGLPGATAAASIESTLANIANVGPLNRLSSVLGVMHSSAMMGAYGNFASSNDPTSSLYNVPLPNPYNTVTVSGGNLQQLAAQHYGDASQWPVIAQANNMVDTVISGVQSIAIPQMSANPSGTPAPDNTATAPAPSSGWGMSDAVDAIQQVGAIIPPLAPVSGAISAITSLFS